MAHERRGVTRKYGNGWQQAWQWRNGVKVAYRHGISVVAKRKSKNNISLASAQKRQRGVSKARKAKWRVKGKSWRHLAWRRKYGENIGGSNNGGEAA
jgi:hypothetical protein